MVDKFREFCLNKYPEKIYAHALRVESYLMKDLRFQLMTKEQQDICRITAIGHDLLEDTDIAEYDLPRFIPFEAIDAIVILTKKKEEKYDSYINAIIASGNVYAIIVKQADMLDHLSLVDTLTPKLRAKYEPVVPMLIGVK